MILDVQKCTYSRSEGKKLIFTNTETGEEVFIRKDLVGVTEFYLKRMYLECMHVYLNSHCLCCAAGTSTARLGVYNGEAVNARLPGMLNEPNCDLLLVDLY